LKGRGNFRAYILARLDRDGHVELAAKVRVGSPSSAGHRSPINCARQRRKSTGFCRSRAGDP
jgi:hypothetical protein